MKILITGACGFVGSSLVKYFVNLGGYELVGLDNLSRPGSEVNQGLLQSLGVPFVKGDVRNPEDIASVGKVDWVIDASANPSVLAGVDGHSSSKDIFDNNLISTINLLEFCKEHTAGFILLSTSRVYSIKELSSLPMVEKEREFVLESGKQSLGFSARGITESFPTSTPISLYGVSKLASEQIALEYGETFQFPVWIDRCGVLAGAGQFGRPDQGIFSFWINSYLRKKPLKYIGFGGNGYQVRDLFHPDDLGGLLVKQMSEPEKEVRRIANVGGGLENSISLFNLSEWCEERFGFHEVKSSGEERHFDIPWMVMDSAQVKVDWDWKVCMKMHEIFEDIAGHAEKHGNWLSLSGVS